MIIYPCEELGCFYRLNGSVLESAPIHIDGTYDRDEFGEREIGDNVKFMFQGKMRTFKSIENIIIGIISRMESAEV